MRILRDHESLEQAANQFQLPWLRGWTFRGELFLQSPSSWPEESHRDKAALTELLAHELTHALLYQRLTNEVGALAEEPPLWFREGMASVTAHQQAHRMNEAQLRSWQRVHPGADLFAPTQALLRDEHGAVYSAAHLAFQRLLDEHGEAAILGLLDEERAGSSFDAAFRDRLGVSEAAFLATLL